MSKVKISRKSTNIDMTAMCDVAFLLLTFFMLATKFKPQDPVEIKTPNSVSSKVLPDKDVMMISFDREGQVFFQMDDPDKKLQTLMAINNSQKLGLTPTQMKAFVNAASMGIPFSKLSSFLSLNSEDASQVKQDGIPVDSTNNELAVWVQAALASYTGKQLRILIKGDNAARYENFKNVIEVLKKNEQFKFLLITSPEDAPEGTALWKQRNPPLIVEQ